MSNHRRTTLISAILGFVYAHRPKHSIVTGVTGTPYYFAIVQSIIKNYRIQAMWVMNTQRRDTLSPMQFFCVFLYSNFVSFHVVFIFGAILNFIIISFSYFLFRAKQKSFSTGFFAASDLGDDDEIFHALCCLTTICHITSWRGAKDEFIASFWNQQLKVSFLWNQKWSLFE